jgi:hypothetical protein
MVILSADINRPMLFHEGWYETSKLRNDGRQTGYTQISRDTENFSSVRVPTQVTSHPYRCFRWRSSVTNLASNFAWYTYAKGRMKRDAQQGPGGGGQGTGVRQNYEQIWGSLDSCHSHFTRDSFRGCGITSREFVRFPALMETYSFLRKHRSPTHLFASHMFSSVIIYFSAFSFVPCLFPSTSWISYFKTNEGKRPRDFHVRSATRPLWRRQ